MYRIHILYPYTLILPAEFIEGFEFHSRNSFYYNAFNLGTVSLKMTTWCWNISV